MPDPGSEALESDPEITGYCVPRLDDLDDDSYYCRMCVGGNARGLVPVYLGETHGDLAQCEICGDTLNRYDRWEDDDG